MLPMPRSFEKGLAKQEELGAVGADGLFFFFTGVDVHFLELDDGLEGGGAFFSNELCCKV